MGQKSEKGSIFIIYTHRIFWTPLGYSARKLGQNCPKTGKLVRKKIKKSLFFNFDFPYKYDKSFKTHAYIPNLAHISALDQKFSLP